MSSQPVRHAAGTGACAALTFDDGPNGACTEALLDVLARHGAVATFCVVGEQARTAEGARVLRRVVAEGHLLASHATTYADLGDWDEARVREDLLTSLADIRSAVGDPDLPVRWFRAPNGSWGCSAQVAVELGMQPLAVVNTIGDWRVQDVPTLVARLRTAMRPGEVVVAHDGGGDRRGTVAAVDAVLAERRAAGWRFLPPAPG